MSYITTGMVPEKDLLEARAAAVSKMEKLDKKVQGRSMTDEEEADWNKIGDKIDDLTTKIERGRRYKQRKAKAARIADGLAEHTTDAENPLSAALTAMSEGQVRSITDANLPDIMQRAVTSVGAGDTIQGDNKLGEYFFTPLQNQPLGAIGLEIVPNVVQNEAVVNFTDLPATTIHAEGTEITEGGIISKLLIYILKNFVLRVDIVNNVIRDAVTDWGRILREAFNVSLDAKLTAQFLRGPGGTEITGIDNVAGVQTVDAGSTTLNWDMILQSVQKIVAQNGVLDRIAVVMHPAAWLQLQSLKDTTGQQITMPSGLMDVNMVVHTAVATDYGAGNDETRVYVGDFSTCKLGIGGKYEITNAAAKADHDVTQYIMVYRADLKVFHPERIVRIENVATA